jgi:hypothetical protein
MIVVAAALYFGWLQRGGNYLSTKAGAGYLLGIVGGSLMLVLLLSPTNKRILLSLLNFLRNNLLLLSTAIILLYGWTLRDDNYLSAEDGTGYLLGILGGSLMLAILLYPLSKRVTLLTRLLPMRYWFGFHMFLGTVGPAMILFHANFHLGSTNSSIALTSMLLSAGSGIMGRYLYTRIHNGLYGKRLKFKDLKQKTEDDHAELLEIYAKDEKLSKLMDKMEEMALRPYTGMITSLSHVIYLAVNTPRLKRKVLRLLNKIHQENRENSLVPDSKVVNHLIKHYMLALRRVAAFRVYERLFSNWHMLHLPLFFMMIMTAVVHIFAVHMY